MTNLLKRAIKKAQNLPEDRQDLIAAVILKEIDADDRWDELFGKTTEEQWEQMEEEVKNDIRDGKTLSDQESSARIDVHKHDL